MQCWQVWAQSAAGALFTCGLQAPGEDQANQEALRRLPFDPLILRVTPIIRG